MGSLGHTGKDSRSLRLIVGVQQLVFLEGGNRREAAGVFGLSRETAVKAYRVSLPLSYMLTRSFVPGL